MAAFVAIGATVAGAALWGTGASNASPIAVAYAAPASGKALQPPVAKPPAQAGRPAQNRSGAAPAKQASAQLLPHGRVDRVDLGPGNTKPNAGILDKPSISADGRWIAFASFAGNLVPPGVKEKAKPSVARRSDVFVRDRLTGRTILASAAPDGHTGNDSSSAPVLSADGQWVAFESYADNLVPGAVRHGITNVYLRDLTTGRTVLVSGARGRAGDADSGTPSIDAHGDRVAFESAADDLVADDQNKHGDVFVFDRSSGALRRASLDFRGAELPTGSGGPSIDATGKRVAFLVAGTRGGDCQDVYLKDLDTGVLTLASVGTQSAGGCGRVGDVALSGDGRHVGFATTWPLAKDDHDSTTDVYVRDLDLGVTTRVSAPQHPSPAYDRGESYGPALSSDGRWVAFTSYATDLGPGAVPRTNSAYLADLRTGRVSMIAGGPDGVHSSDSTYGVGISPDGGHLAFAAVQTDASSGATKKANDVFVLDRSGPRYPAAQPPKGNSAAPGGTQIEIGPVGTVEGGFGAG